MVCSQRIGNGHAVVSSDNDSEFTVGTHIGVFPAIGN